MSENTARSTDSSRKKSVKKKVNADNNELTVKYTSSPSDKIKDFNSMLYAMVFVVPFDKKRADDVKATKANARVKDVNSGAIPVRKAHVLKEYVISVVKEKDGKEEPKAKKKANTRKPVREGNTDKIEEK